MMKSMFCPKCGAAAQSAESYCRRCGEWLPDVDALVRPGLFRRRTREERIRKMRVLEVVSAGLSLTAAAIIISVLAGRGDTQLLFLAAFCCVLVAAYQAVNFYLGHKLQQRADHSRAGSVDEIEAGAGKGARALSPADMTTFAGGSSIVENTTELLEPIPREGRRDK
jgi:hypothetical protein